MQAWKIFLAVCAGSLVGSGASQLILGFDRGSRAITTIPEQDAALSEVAGQLGEIARQLRGLDERRVELQPSERLPTVLSTPPVPTEGIERFERATEQLERSLDRMETSLQARNPEAFPESVPPPDDTALAALKQLDAMERNRKHMFWTQPQILARYGQPDVIRPRAEGLEWIYRFRSPNPVSVFFADGRVASIQIPE